MAGPQTDASIIRQSLTRPTVFAEIFDHLALIADLQGRRAELESGGEPGQIDVVGVGRSNDGELWGLAGIAGEDD